MRLDASCASDESARSFSSERAASVSGTLLGDGLTRSMRVQHRSDYLGPRIINAI